MNALIAEFQDLWARKTAAKYGVVMPAVGAAIAAEAAGDDVASGSLWQEVAAYGAAGHEGDLQAQAVAVAQRFVEEHRAMFSGFEQYDSDAGHDKLVEEISTLRKSANEFARGIVARAMGLEAEEVVDALAMYELATFERRSMGATLTVHARSMRLGGA